MSNNQVFERNLSIVANPSFKSNVVKVKAVGDIMLIAGAAIRLNQLGPEYPFCAVAQFIQAGDIGFGNLEMPICSDTSHPPHFPDVCPDFHCPPQTAEALKMTGFDVLNLANNHIMDWGIAGLRETLACLRTAGLQTIGAGENLAEARKPAIFNRKGLRVAFIGYGVRGLWNAKMTQPGTAPIDRNLILEDIREIRHEVDLLVVSLHTGILSDYPNPEDRQLAKELIDNGADLIIGHGPHVTQGVEIYKNKAIAYSLGNFMIDLSSGNVENKIALREHLESIILDVTLNRERTLDYNIIPIEINENFQTVPANPEAASRIQARMDELSQNLEKMQGLALWEHAGARNVEHELRVLEFQLRQVGFGHIARRLKKLRWRHLRLFLGYLVSKARKAFARLPEKETP